MPSVSKLIKDYLKQGRVMQLATVNAGRPWICTVYYVEDEQQNLYWLSLPSRRHSQEVTAHPKVAVAIVIKHDQPVIGIQAEGQAEQVVDPLIVKKIMGQYTKRHQAGRQFYNNFITGKNRHYLYKCTPASFVLFDEQSFNSKARQEWVRKERI